MDLEQRIARLERANSRLKALVVVIGLVSLGLATVAAAPDTQPVDLIRAKKIEIVDSAGVARIRLDVSPPTTNRGQIEFRTADGKKKETVIEEYGLGLYDEADQDLPRTTFSLNNLRMRDPRGASVELLIGRKGTNRAELSLGGPKGFGTLAADEHGECLTCHGSDPSAAQATIGVCDMVAKVNVSDPGREAASQDRK